MDIEKLLKFGIEYLSDYITMFFVTLSRPSDVSQLMQRQHKETATRSVVAPSSASVRTSLQRISPTLLSFVIISIILGSTLQSIIPNHSSATELLDLIVIIIIMWVVYASFIHLLSRLLGGRADWALTLSVSLQVISVVYVIASLIALIWGVVAYLSLWQIVEALVLQREFDVKMEKIPSRIVNLIGIKDSMRNLYKDLISSLAESRHSLVHQGKFSQEGFDDFQMLKAVVEQALVALFDRAKKFPTRQSLEDFYINVVEANDSVLRNRLKVIQMILDHRQQNTRTNQMVV